MFQNSPRRVTLIARASHQSWGLEPSWVEWRDQFCNRVEGVCIQIMYCSPINCFNKFSALRKTMFDFLHVSIASSVKVIQKLLIDVCGARNLNSGMWRIAHSTWIRKPIFPSSVLLRVSYLLSHWVRGRTISHFFSNAMLCTFLKPLSSIIIITARFD